MKGFKNERKKTCFQEEVYVYFSGVAFLELDEAGASIHGLAASLAQVR